MNSINFFLWLMPVVFMIHEFEEIFMIEAWWGRYKEKIKTTWPKRMPFGLDHAGPFLSASIGMGIFYEYLVFVLACIICAVFNNYYAWYGLFGGFVLHMVMLHLRDVIKFKGYTPGMVTCAILFIPSIWMLYQSAVILQYGILEVVLSIVVVEILLAAVVFGKLHQWMASWAQRLYQYSQGEAAK